MKVKLLALLGTALLTGEAMAGGFQVNLQGQKQIGMGHAGVGLAMDEASIFFNPGAMSHLRENGFSVGMSGIISKVAYQDMAPGNTITRTDNPTGTPVQAYAVWGPEDAKFKAGLGVYTPFGSKVNWGDDWQGRYVLTSIELQSIFIQPTVSYKITDKLGIGAGFIYAIGDVNLQRNIPVQNMEGQDGTVELDGRARGYGFNAGVYFAPTDMISIGLNYRSKVDMEVEGGNVIFNTAKAQPVASRFPDDTKFDATLALPANITLGLGIKPTDDLTIAIDVQRVQWSAYKSLRFEFSQEVNGTKVEEKERNYEDVFIYRLGLQYRLSDMLTVRTGGYYDNSPVQEGYLTPETPDANAIGLSAGLSLNVTEKFGVDASFLFIDKKQRTDLGDKSGGIAGTYKTRAYIPGLALNYKF